MTKETLSRAMTGIDNNLIREAHEEEHLPRPAVRIPLIRIAACLCLAAALSASAAFFKPKSEGMPPNKGADAAENTNAAIITHYGSVTFHTVTEHTVEFTLVKATDDPVSFSVSGYMLSHTENDTHKDGESIFRESFLATTDKNAPVTADKMLYDALSVTVDGKASPDGTLPGGKGTYEITVDFSSLDGNGIFLNDFCTVSGFGNFRIFSPGETS